MTYSSVVSRESVRIALKIAALNYVDLLDYNIHNAYLMADYREQVWVTAVTNFGSKAGKNMMERKTLYVMKISST